FSSAAHNRPAAQRRRRQVTFDSRNADRSLLSENRRLYAACLVDRTGTHGRNSKASALGSFSGLFIQDSALANLFPSTDRSWPRHKNLSLGSLANRYHDAALRPKSQLREALLRLPLTNREAVRGFAWPKHLRPCVPFPHGLPRPLPLSSREAEYEAAHQARFPMRLSVRLLSCRSRTPPDVPAAKKSRRRRGSHAGAGRRFGKEQTESPQFE